jgi:hypothetical protein
MMTAPAARKRSTTVASWRGWRPENSGDPHSVG